MNAGADRIANELDGKIQEIDAVLRETSEAQWRDVCPSEGWPLGVVAFHITLGIERQAGWVEDALAGRGPFEFSWAQTDALNAAVADSGILPSKAFVLGALAGARSRIHAALGRMSEDELERDALAYEGKPVPVRIVMRIFIRHVDEHFASIRAKLDAPA